MANDVIEDTTPRVLGTCTMDLVCLFLGTLNFLESYCILQIYFWLGQESVTETLLILPSYRKFDENMIASKELPRVIVRLVLENRWTLLDTKQANILSFTVESMYNIPSLMVPEMEYNVCTVLPSFLPVGTLKFMAWMYLK